MDPNYTLTCRISGESFMSPPGILPELIEKATANVTGGGQLDQISVRGMVTAGVVAIAGDGDNAVAVAAGLLPLLASRIGSDRQQEA